MPPPTILPVSERAATINVTYTGFSADAQTAFQYAVDIWETLINSTRVININATWAPAAPTNLGSAGPASVWANFTGAPISNTWYAQALAESICNCSIGSNPDITANFNSSRTDWYFGTDGNTPAGEYDFVSVVLHEIGHGLGFIGSGSVDGAGVGSLGLGDDSWAIIYDLFVENLGVSVTGYGNPSVILGNVLQGSGNLVWNGTNGVAGNGGLMPEISDPATWTGGSSYHHFDETYFPAGDMNSLMTPQLSAAEAIHHPGESGLGLLQDIGWSVNTSSGCTDPDACNFDLTAIVDDGSCTYFWYLPDVVSSGPAIQACTAPANYHLAVSQACVESVVAADSWCSNVNWDNLCQTDYECCQDEGCTDPAACNYDPDACTESGSCIYCFENCVNLTLFDSFGDGWNGASWEFLDEMGVSWANGTLSSGSEITETFCLNSGCYNFAVTSGSWPSEVSWELVGANGGVITGGAGESISVSFGAVLGCTDPIACNYDTTACSDDGSCDYYYSPPTTLLDTEWFVEYDWGCTGTPGNEVWTLNSDFTYTTPGNPGNWSLCGLSVTLLFESGTIYNGDYNIVGGYFEGTINGGPHCFTMSPVVDGCTDSTACNYNAYANVDDGSCNNLAPVVDMTGANWLLDYDGGCDGSIAEVVFALFYADNTWDLPDFSNNGWWTLCGTTLELWQGAELFFIGEWSYVDFTFSGPFYDNGVEVGCGDLYLQVAGCTAATACNYDASANTDDGSCVYPTCDDPLACNYDECSDPISVCYDAISCYEASACTYAIGWSLGCTYIDAINYDPTATVDDGSCVYDLPSLCGAGTYYDAVT
ncbi:MAG TPA: hypothetical protein EYN28_04630, partial [Flavobacteriales bacterium]|nr:hypothetical protein [Flavobacteriales bacterium]